MEIRDQDDVRLAREGETAPFRISASPRRSGARPGSIQKSRGSPPRNFARSPSAAGTA